MKRSLSLLFVILFMFAGATAYAAKADVKVSHFRGGISTAKDDVDVLADYPYPDESVVYKFYNDFMWYTAGDWTVTTTEAGTSDATEALRTDVAGGVLKLSNDFTIGDKDGVQLQGESFLLTSGKQAWLKTRIAVGGTTDGGYSSAIYSDIMVGLVITDTTPMSHTDGIVFKKDSGDAYIDFSSLKNSAGSVDTQLSSIATDTFVELGVYFDGKDAHLYVDGEKVSTVEDVVICDDEYLTPTVYIANGATPGPSAKNRNLSIDYLLTAVER